MFPDFLDETATAVAKQLLGCYMVRTIGGKQIKVMIVETESYDSSDEASHTYRGKTTRNQVMFGPSGYLYVYFTYGLYYCCNVVTGAEGDGSAVLIRAVQPVEGVIEMEKYRQKSGLEVSNGPAKLCQALQIDISNNGHDLRQPPIRLMTGEPLDSDQIIESRRIGISRAVHELRRFYIRGNPYVSRK